MTLDVFVTDGRNFKTKDTEPEVGNTVAGTPRPDPAFGYSYSPVGPPDFTQNATIQIFSETYVH